MVKVDNPVGFEVSDLLYLFHEESGRVADLGTGEHSPQDAC